MWCVFSSTNLTNVIYDVYLEDESVWFLSCAKQKPNNWIFRVETWTRGNLPPNNFPSGLTARSVINGIRDAENPSPARTHNSHTSWVWSILYVSLIEGAVYWNFPLNFIIKWSRMTSIGFSCHPFTHRHGIMASHRMVAFLIVLKLAMSVYFQFHSGLVANGDVLSVLFDCNINFVFLSSTLSYYHHQIGSMNYYPLFRVRSWNNGVRFISLSILMKLWFGWIASWDIRVLVVFAPNLALCHWHAALLPC